MRSGYCPKHAKAKQQRYDESRGSARERDYDSVWDRVSRQYRRAHPLCEDCEAEGGTTAVELVHHIVPLDEGGPRLDWSNLRSLCQHHHQVEHAQ